MLCYIKKFFTRIKVNKCTKMRKYAFTMLMIPILFLNFSIFKNNPPIKKVNKTFQITPTNLTPSTIRTKAPTYLPSSPKPTKKSTQTAIIAKNISSSPSKISSNFKVFRNPRNPFNSKRSCGGVFTTGRK